ncbi:MAG: diguanylate cyclase [Chloroflexia bacterium]
MVDTAELIAPLTQRLAASPGPARILRDLDLADIVAQLPVIVRVIATDGTYLLSEGQGLALIGQRPGDRVGQSIFAVQHARPDIQSDLRRALNGEELHTVREVNGRVWESQYSPLRRHGELIGTLYVAMDITARARAEDELRASELRARALRVAAERQARDLALLDRVRTSLARELDPAAVYRVVVEAIAATFGYTQVSLYSRSGEMHQLQDQVGYDRVLARIPVSAGVSGRAVASGKALLISDVTTDPDFLGAIDGIASEICIPLYDAGQPAGFLNVESVGKPLDETDLGLIAALGEQVGIAIERARLYAALREREARLAHQATHDALTGLPNRALFLERLDTALATVRASGTGASVAVLFIDLDGFKEVNDHLGHLAGDLLLVATARRLQDCLGPATTAARLGGDEFAILLDAPATPAVAEHLARQILAALAPPVYVGIEEACITASIGIAHSLPTDTVDTLLSVADDAMYRAKRIGPGNHSTAARPGHE